MKRVIKGEKRILIPLMILSLALIFNFCISGVSAASGDIIYVNGSSGNDSWDGLSAAWTSGTNGPKLSIKNATGTINNGGIVKIADGDYKGVNNTKITINKNMTIIGESQTGTIINGTNSAWIFKIQSGITVTIENLTLKNGYAYNGGAIYNNGNLTVSGGRFTNNYAYVAGSVIYNHGTLTVIESSFLNNDADGGYGYPVYMNAAGAIYNDGYLTVMDSYFSENYVGCGNGAAIHNSGFAIVNNTEFIGNTAYGSGGAIYNDNRLNIANSNFIVNIAYFDGGAVYNDYGGIYTANSCHFELNIPQDIYNATDPSSGEDKDFSDDQGSAVKAASKTVPLQKAGLPLAGLISAILLVLGGSAVSKRR